MIVESFSYAAQGSKSPGAWEVDCRSLAATADFGEADGRAVEAQERLLEADRDRVLALVETAYREAKGGGHVAFGCADGRVRSVAMAEMLARMLRENGFHPVMRHAALE